MPGRESVGFSDLAVFARRLGDGSLANRPGATLEVSKFVWDQNSFEAQQAFEAACEQHGIKFAVVERVGGIEWTGP
ncbi:MAG TPA: hypothetical protein VFL95_01090 [Gemmatimonadales bacterium]|nr:hypothetical protein [Gemmatimonadales bacterium]